MFGMGDGISRKSGPTFEWIGCDNSTVCCNLFHCSIHFKSVIVLHFVQTEYRVNFIFQWKISQNRLFALQHQHFHRQHHRLCHHAHAIHCIAPNAPSKRPNCQSPKIQLVYWNASLKATATKKRCCQRDQPKSKCVQYAHFKCFTKYFYGKSI